MLNKWTLQSHLGPISSITCSPALHHAPLEWSHLAPSAELANQWIFSAQRQRAKRPRGGPCSAGATNPPVPYPLPSIPTLHPRPPPCLSKQDRAQESTTLGICETLQYVPSKHSLSLLFCSNSSALDPTACNQKNLNKYTHVIFHPLRR